MKKIIKKLAPLAILASVAVVASCTKSGENNNSSTDTTSLSPASSGVVKSIVSTGRKIYVSPDGDVNSDGLSKDKPTIWAIAHSTAKAGDTILLAEGTYKSTSRSQVGLSNSGKAGAYITVRPEVEGSKVVFDYSEMSFNSNNRGIQIYSDYWYFYGIDIKGAGDNGMYISGSHNVIENCQFYENRDTGLQIGRADSADTKIDKWPSYNLILNCTSFANYDDETFGENADGFAAKLTLGVGNIFDGCIAFRNSDDGWDLYAKQDSGNIGTVTMYNCVSFENGYLPYPIEQDNGGVKIKTYDTLNGDGIGFKLGGSTMEGDVVMENCLSFNNKLHGVGDNSNPGTLSLKNVTTFNNCAGVDNETGLVKDKRGIDGVTNKSNNFDLARTSASYNNYYGLVSYISNQKNYSPDGDSSYNEDAIRGSMAYSIINTSYDATNKKEIYKSFGSYADASTWNDGVTDTAFSTGTVCDALTDSDFADLTAINAKVDDVKDVDSLLSIHSTYRNSDGSINMGNKVKIVSEKLLTFADGNPIGATLDKTSYEEYNHPTFYTFGYSEKELTEDEVEVLAAYSVTDVICNPDVVFQSFDIPTYIQGCDITWESSNTDVIEIGKTEDISVSLTSFVKAEVKTPKEKTTVKLTATITNYKYKITKEFNITVYPRTQELGKLTSSASSDKIRVDKYGVYTAPVISAYDNSSIDNTLIPSTEYTMVTEYYYATSGNATYYQIDDVYTSVPGVYKVITTATSKDEKTISTYEYYVYVVDPDCEIDFTSTPSLALTSDGFSISGKVSNVEGYLYTLVSETELKDVTEDTIIKNENTQVYHIESDEIAPTFTANNNKLDSSIAYYVYYTIKNANSTNTNTVRAPFVVKTKEISSELEFYKLARYGKPDNETYDSGTIFYLTKDLDFSTLWNGNEENQSKWEITDKSTSTAFTGLLNGNGHTVSNITINDSEKQTDSNYQKVFNVFYKVSNGTIMNVNFDNIKIKNTNSTTGKLIGIIGDLNGGYLYNIKLTNISMEGRESVGGLVGQITGKTSYIERCQLINPIPEDAYNNTTGYVISSTNKYQAGLIGNIQKNSDESYISVTVKNCGVIANIGDAGSDNTGVDAGGNTGGIIGRMKNDSTEYTLTVTNCYYHGTLIAKGQYNAGIVGDFDNGSGYVSIRNCYSDVVFIYNGLKLDAKEAYTSKDYEYTYAHKNSNPIVGRAVSSEIGIYDTGSNIGTWTEYYSTYIKSSSIYFDLTGEEDEEAYTVSQSTLSGMCGFDFDTVWTFDQTTGLVTLK